MPCLLKSLLRFMFDQKQFSSLDNNICLSCKPLYFYILIPDFGTVSHIFLFSLLLKAILNLAGRWEDVNPQINYEYRILKLSYHSLKSSIKVSHVEPQTVFFKRHNPISPYDQGMLLTARRIKIYDECLPVLTFGKLVYDQLPWRQYTRRREGR